jgi:uncharacterized protein
MRIDVSELLKGPVGSSCEVLINESIEDETLDHIEGSMTLTRTNRGILTKGTVNATIKGTCNRCLEPAITRAQLDIVEEVLQGSSSPASLSSSNRSENYSIYSNQILDLNEIIDQYARLATPMKLLCQPDCAGICPSCGHNLNQGACTCASQAQDPRWMKLINRGKEDRA